MLQLQPPLLRPLIVTPHGQYGQPRPHRDGVHLGTDYQADEGDQVVSASPGRVVRTGFDPPPPGGGGGGNFVIVESSADGERWEVGYMHLSRIDVSKGDQVAAGDPIGAAGMTGNTSSGPHLHIQVKRLLSDGNKQPIDPTTLMVGAAVGGGLLLLGLVGLGVAWYVKTKLRWF